LVTSWVDLSLVYGNDAKMNREVRTFKNGKLKTSYNKYSKREQLPYRDGVQSCLGLGYCKKCSFAGDSRHEDNGFLNAIHTIFVREHNRVAKKLLYWNPYWDDETTFQEARRIVIAEYQNIVYAEFLPLLVGEKVARQFDLIPNEDGYFMGYDYKVNPNTYNEFSVAAARYGHTLVKNWQLRADVDYNIQSNRTVDHYLFNPELPEYGGGIESMVRAAMFDFSYYPTSQVNDYLNNHLAKNIFYKETGNKQFSLPALNIQRGRDHGVQPYVVYREMCGLSRPYSFEDLTNMPKNVINQLRKVYKSVEDIDLWTGMVSEYPLENAAVGPTQACKFEYFFFSLFNF
jgi:peroxidase